MPIGADDLLREMDAAGVQRAVLVPPNWDDYRCDLALAAARLHPQRFAVIGRPDTQSPHTRHLIATWRRQPGMLGLRCSFTRPQHGAMLLEGRLEWLWEEAEKAGMPIMVAVPHANLDAIDTVARRYPGLRIAIDHLGIPKGKKDEAAFRDVGRLLALAARSNISVKATALPDFTEDAYPYRRLHPYLRRIFEAFGAKRIFWGSDVSRPRCSNYAQLVTMFTEEMPWLTSEDKEWIMGRGLCEWLGWEVPRHGT